MAMVVYLDEVDSEGEVFDPRGEWFERGIRRTLPLLGHLFVQEGLVDQLQLFAHHHQPLDRLLQFLQSGLQREKSRNKKHQLINLLSVGIKLIRKLIANTEYICILFEKKQTFYANQFHLKKTQQNFQNFIPNKTF